jgi:chromosome partitioning protein
MHDGTILWEALHGEEPADGSSGRPDTDVVGAASSAGTRLASEWGGGVAPTPAMVGELVGAAALRDAPRVPPAQAAAFHVEPVERVEVRPPGDPTPATPPSRETDDLAPGESARVDPREAGLPSASRFHVEPVAAASTPTVFAEQRPGPDQPDPGAAVADRPTLASLLTTGHRASGDAATPTSLAAAGGATETSPAAPRVHAEHVPPQGPPDVTVPVSRGTTTGASGVALTDRDQPPWEDHGAGRAGDATLSGSTQAPREQPPTRQTAPAGSPTAGTPGPTDGSAGMHERTGDVGPPVATAASWTPTGWLGERAHTVVSAAIDLQVSYDDLERVDLARSLPSFDDSTPLAAEVAEDARRRITLSGRTFPQPPRTRILTVANQKGGVGKTTTTVNLAAALAQAGLNVLVLDIDPQGNASTALGVEHHSEIPSLYDVVVEGMPLKDVLQACPQVANLWCAPATIDLAGAEIELVSLVARETRLQKALTAYLEERTANGEPQIDYVFVDCPPSLSLLTVNAFVAAREVLIPIQCEYYALEGLSQLLKHVELIRGHLNTSLHVSTILLTMYDGRTRLSAQVADEVREHFPEQVVKTTVPRSVRISEAPSHGQTVMTYDPASSGALSYLEAARELAEQVLTWHDLTTTEERV